MKKFLIKVNGKQYNVEVDEVPGDLSAAKENAPKKVNPSPEGVISIISPMPGTILKVNVKTDDAVKKGHVLLVLEAMKMENEILAPSDGRVTAVNVEKGKTVCAGDCLISLV